MNTTVGARGADPRRRGIDTRRHSSGQVAQLWVPPGELAKSGTRLYSVQGADGRIHTVNAPWDAYVVSTLVAVGQLVEPGTPVADLERVRGTSDPLEAVVFVPAADAPAIPPGKEVTLTRRPCRAPSSARCTGPWRRWETFPRPAGRCRRFSARTLTSGATSRRAA